MDISQKLRIRHNSQMVTLLIQWQSFQLPICNILKLVFAAVEFYKDQN